MRSLSSLNKTDGKELTNKVIDFLTNFKPGLFYAPPKIHKIHIVNETIKYSPKTYIHTPNPENLKLRSIVASTNCETQTQSIYGYIIKIPTQTCQQLPQRWIRHAKSPTTNVKEEAITVTFDVINLYKSISHDYGLDAIHFCLNQHPEEIEENMSKEFITESVEFIV